MDITRICLNLWHSRALFYQVNIYNFSNLICVSFRSEIDLLLWQILKHHFLDFPNLKQPKTCVCKSYYSKIGSGPIIYNHIKDLFGILFIQIHLESLGSIQDPGNLVFQIQKRIQIHMNWMIMIMK